MKDHHGKWNEIDVVWMLKWIFGHGKPEDFFFRLGEGDLDLYRKHQAPFATLEGTNPQTPRNRLFTHAPGLHRISDVVVIVVVQVASVEHVSVPELYPNVLQS